MKANLSRYPKGNGKRRIDIQIDPFDTWSLDHTIASIILPALIQLKHTKHGVPSGFTDRFGGDFDNNLVFDFIKEDDTEVFNQLCDSWDDVLDKMIWSFLQLSIEDDYDSQYHHGKMEIAWEKLPDELHTDPVTGTKEPLYQMVDKNPGEHWYDHIGSQEHEKRIQEGLELFGKHFRDLWD
jgi:hypothetical protein